MELALNFRKPVLAVRGWAVRPFRVPTRRPLRLPARPRSAPRSAPLSAASPWAGASGEAKEGRVPHAWRWLAVVLLLGMIVRLAVWLAFAGMPVQIVDAQDYDRLAVALVETGEYQTPAGTPSSLRPPLYAWCVATVYRGFGVQNYEPVRLGQAGLGLLTVVLVFLIGQKVFSERVGLVAAALYCFYPSGIAFHNLILSETLFTLLVALATWLTLEASSRRAASLFLVVGVILGLGALTRSILWLYVPLLGLFVLGWGMPSRTRRVAATALLGIGFAITIAPWAYRNTQVQRTFTLIDVMGGRNVMMGNYEHTPLERSWATIETVQGDDSWIHVLRRHEGSLQGLTQGQIDKRAMRYGIAFILDHPGLTLQRTVVRAFNFWQLDRSLLAGLQAGFWGAVSKPQWLMIAVVVVGGYVLLAWAGIWGIALAEPREGRFHALLLMNLLFPWIVHAGIFAHSRYHLPLMPLVAVYAAFALVAGRRRWQEVGPLSRWLAGGGCLLLSLGWLREFLMVDLPRLGGGL